MDKTNSIFKNVAVGLLGLVLIGSGLLYSGQDDVKITEKVEVINVEVPVRVFYRGELVRNLTKKDFTLYEGDEKQFINGFYSKKKSISSHDVKLKPQHKKNRSTSRYIVLIFRTTDYNIELRKGIDYLFENIIKPHDELLIFINDKTISLSKSYWKIDRKDILLQMLKEECIHAHQRLISYFLTIQKELDRTQMKLIEDDSYSLNAFFIIEFLRRYLTTWQEYKKKYLIPDLDKYYNFAKHLDKINKEKWIINFYQIEMFPMMKITGRLRQRIENMISQLMVARSEDAVHSQIISRFLEDIDTALKVSDEFPIDEIAKLMYKVDTTFHSIFMGVEKETLNQDLQFKKVSSDIENCLRELTEKTGGALITTGDLGSALHSIKNKEDLYYVLTYVPRNPQKKGKIRVSVNNKKYDVVYDDNIRADYISEYLKARNAEVPAVTLSGITFHANRLNMTVTDFFMPENKTKQLGKLNVRVRLINDQSENIFDQKRLIVARKEDVNISISFEAIPPAKYSVIIDVTDLYTGRTAMDFLDSIQTE
jgi:hypothetical protein